MCYHSYFRISILFCFVLILHCVPSEEVDNLSPREDLEICTRCHRKSFHEDFTQVQCDFHCALSEDFDSLPPREDLEISQEAIRACINEQLIQIYNSLFDFRPTCEVGIVGFE
ncbi:hypothetical protein V1477_004241 [Vespula maculifrons]|uniref:Uncharacterized protein n=1 Tax=Vespula maculifrons TaxID=7453 RepID=A0ABD2CR04_VESMC